MAPPPSALELREDDPPTLTLRQGEPVDDPASVPGWPVNQPPLASGPAAASRANPAPPPPPPVAVPRPLEVTPLTAGLSRLHVTVSREFLRKLEAAQDALSAAMPDATPAEILEAGLELLLDGAAKRKGLVERPRKQVRPTKGDHIPAHVRREVWKRDGGRCQYPLASGGICGATRHLEFDHITPRSLGGASTAENVRIACKPHNDLAARLILGDELMDRYTSGLRGAPRQPRQAGASRDAPGVASPP